MLARRAGMAQQLCLAVAVALWCGVASAAGPPPPVVKGGKFVTLTSKNNYGHKRNYQVTCVDKDNPAGCNVGCPAKRCPNQYKGREFAEMFDVIGDGLLVAVAASWARQKLIAVGCRRLQKPHLPVLRAVHHGSMARQTVRLLVPFLDHAAAATSPGGVDIQDVLTRYALDVFYASAFDADLDVLSVAAASTPVPPA